MTLPDFSAAWSAALTTLVPLLIMGAIARTQRFKAWRVARRESKEQLQAMAAKWQGFEAGLERHFNDIDAARTKVTSQFKAIAERLDAQDRALATILSMTMGQFEMSPTPSFVCDPMGRNTNVNAAYATMLGVGRDDLMEFRYRSFIPPEVLGPHLALFDQAVRDHREFENEIVMVRADRTRVRIRVHMIPYPRELGPATHWIGTISALEAA